MIDVSIIIVSYNTKKLTLKCIASVKKFVRGVVYEVIVIDNCSSDGSADAIDKLTKVQLIANSNNMGFGAANNQGIKNARGRHILLLNPDTELVEDSVSIMISWMDLNKQVGVSSCRLIYPNGSLQPTGGFFPNIVRMNLWTNFSDDSLLNPFGSYHPPVYFYNQERVLDWVTGAFLLMRREVLDDIKGFDEDYFLYVEEVDLCYRAKKAGWVVHYMPLTSVIHHKGASVTTENMIILEFQGLKLFYKKHYSAIEGLLLKVFLIYGCLVRVIVFAIMKPGLSKVYARAITKI